MTTTPANAPGQAASAASHAAPASQCPVDHHGYEPFDLDDPFTPYARLRAEAPVHYDERIGYWVIARYADVKSVFENFALECTGVISVVRQAADCVGMLGTCILIGGAPAGAQFSLDHISTLWGKRIVGVLGGSGRSPELIGGLMRLYGQGRFPFDRLIEYFDLADVQLALESSYAGEVVKPVLRIP